MPTIACPHCKGTGALDLPLGRLEAVFYMSIASKYPHGISLEHLIHNCYGHRPDGGPEDADNRIRQLAWRVNKKMKPFGKRIYARGNEYRLTDIR